MFEKFLFVVLGMIGLIALGLLLGVAFIIIAAVFSEGE